MHTARGRFITVEGIEGVGKSTNMAFIASALESNKIPYVMTREPGGTALAEEIRSLVLSERQESVTAITELLLMFAARAQHIEHFIKPHLEAGDWVLCDRFTDSSFAYQGGGREMDIGLLRQLEKSVQGNLSPDLVILLDLSVDRAMDRIRARSDNDRIDAESISFFNRVREAFLERARNNPDRYLVLDASPGIELVQESLRKGLESFINENL